ncbi:MAG: Zn-dependent protease with chaperone function [Rhodocyclaceae bacterium]|nr:Zn-dependent protease with chaperone function [Rhodocyclaceae bacterium]
MKNLLSILLAAALCNVPALADQSGTGSDGVHVGKASALRNLVPAEQLERAAGQQYLQLKQQAAEKGALAPDSHSQVQRLRAIAQRILPHASRFNARAEHWKWEVNLIGSRQLNAFCMPGGKIAFYSGLIDTLKLTDDEIAIVMGHEVAHALREHSREQQAKGQITHGIAAIAANMVAGTKYGGLAQFGIQGAADLATRKFSRDDETEADVVGLDLAARAGFDPRAGISLWQKMGAANRGSAPPAWLSTHPAGRDRIQEIQHHLPEVMPLYEATRRRS